MFIVLTSEVFGSLIAKLFKELLKYLFDLLTLLLPSTSVIETGLNQGVGSRAAHPNF